MIEIIREDFHSHGPTNDWPSLFPEYSEEIESRTSSGLKKLLEWNILNTTAVDDICSNITLMSICKDYFSDGLRGGCGISWIGLLGIVADWRLLKEKNRWFETVRD
jgi:hypothetical protein